MSFCFDESLFKGVDMNEHLRLYHTTDDKYKGIIFNQQHQLVVSNFPVPEEVIVEAGESNIANLKFPMELTHSVEGTLIRLFYYNDEWQMATSSRLDAYTSFWSARQSFGKQFEEYVEAITGTPFEVFLCSLDTHQRYFFLLPTSGLNRLGKTHDEPVKRIYLVAVQTADNKMLYGSDLPGERNAWSYLVQTLVESNEELLDCCQRNPMIYYAPNLEKVVKYVSVEYAERCKLRNNNQDIIAQYFELLRTDPEQATQLRASYPEANLEHYSKQLNMVVNYIHKNYYNRYVKKEYTIVPKVYFEWMKRCHEQYLQTREKTTVQQVYQMIIKQDPKRIISLIRNFSY
jgi:hypothetical protein